MIDFMIFHINIHPNLSSQFLGNVGFDEKNIFYVLIPSTNLFFQW